jgi:hypothetical protein
MPYIFTRDYEEDLFELNSDLHYLIVEAGNKSGGGRKLSRFRMTDRCLPLTLRENFSESGHFDVTTEARDIRLVESEISMISQKSRQGVIVCVPLRPLTNELDYLERLSPKVNAYVLRRLASVGINP